MNSRIIYPALLVTLGIVAFGRQFEVTADPSSGVSANLSLASLTRSQKRQLRTTATVRAVRRVGKAVIAITSTKNIVRDPQFSHRYGAVYMNPRQIISVTSLGSGVIIDSKGHAITNEHVISQATSITVQMADGRRFPARVVGAAPAYDLALIKIKSKAQLPHANLAHSKDLMAGEPAIAIGNPLGLDQTVSRGVISTVNRTISSKGRSYVSFIQTDAAINPGNSGGPLVNLSGEVVGINTAMVRGAQGLGFAIPSDRVKLVLSDLRRFGRVRHPWLGLKVKQRSRGMGVEVTFVKGGGPAAKAGVRRGDIIRAMVGQRVADVYVFRRLARALIPGQRINIVLQRKVVSLTVGGTRRPVALAVNQKFLRRMGFQLANASDYADHYKLKTRRGAVIIAVNRRGQARRQNLRPGDVLVAIGRHLVRNVRDVNRLAHTLTVGHQFVIKIQRKNKVYDVVMRY